MKYKKIFIVLGVCIAAAVGGSACTAVPKEEPAAEDAVVAETTPVESEPETELETEAEPVVEESDPVQVTVEAWMNGIGLTFDDIGKDSDIYMELENLASKNYLSCPGTPYLSVSNYGQGYDYKGTNYPTWSEWHEAFLADNEEELEAIRRESDTGADEEFDFFTYNNLEPTDTNDGAGYDIRIYHYDTLGEYWEAFQGMNLHEPSSYVAGEMELIDSLPERDEIMRIRMEAEIEYSEVFMYRLGVIEEALEPLIADSNESADEEVSNPANYDPDTNGGKGFEYKKVTYATFGEYIDALDKNAKLDQLLIEMQELRREYRSRISEMDPELTEQIDAIYNETDYDTKISMAEEVIADLNRKLEDIGAI